MHAPKLQSVNSTIAPQAAQQIDAALDGDGDATQVESTWLESTRHSKVVFPLRCRQGGAAAGGWGEGGKQQNCRQTVVKTKT